MALATVPSKRHRSSGIKVPSRLLVMVPPIEYDLGYRSRTWTLTLTLTLKLTLILTLKVTIMYAMQNDTQIKFKTVL